MTVSRSAHAAASGMFAFAICSCAAATKTTLKAEHPINPEALGFSKPEDWAALESEFHGLELAFMVATMQTLAEYGVKRSFAFGAAISFENPDADAVAGFCRGNALDGFLLTRLRVLPPGQLSGFDVEAQVKLIDCAGRTIVIASHNTRWGNVYWEVPDLGTVLHDGVRGAVGRVMEECGRKRVREEAK